MNFQRFLKASKFALALSGLSLAMGSQAHPMWILPHQFNLSTEQDKGEWVTFDASASHTVFSPDKGIPLDNARVMSPDGDRQPIGQFLKGPRRSVFDLYLDQNGTYLIKAQRPTLYFTSYKSGKRDTPKRMMANKQVAKARLPKDAREVTTTLIDISTATYVTNNAPSDSVLKPSQKGFEVVFDTHPSDIITGEEVNMVVHLDGKPVAGVEIEITPHGSKYRDERGSIKLTTQADGKVSFVPEAAGPWLFLASLQSELSSPLADSQRSMRYITLEVQPE